MNPPTLPERPSLPQALARVHPARSQAREIIYRGAARGLPDGPTPTRSALKQRDEDGHTEPMHMPAAGQLELDPRYGGCARCRHTEGAHQRGKDTPRGCAGAGCGCERYKQLWTLRDTGWAVFTVLVYLAAFAVILGFAAILIGGGR